MNFDDDRKKKEKNKFDGKRSYLPRSPLRLTFLKTDECPSVSAKD